MKTLIARAGPWLLFGMLLSAGTAQAAAAAPGRWACDPRSYLRLLHLGLAAHVTPRGSSLLPEVRMGGLCVYNRGGDLRRAGLGGLHLVPDWGYGLLLPERERVDERAPLTTATAWPQPGSQTRVVHLGSVGVAAGYGSRWASISLAPRVLAGYDGRGLAVGARHSMVVRLLYEMMTVELGHQVLRADGRWRQGFVAGGSLNLIIIAKLAGAKGPCCDLGLP
jgi:hypothetical protein